MRPLPPRLVVLSVVVLGLGSLFAAAAASGGTTTPSACAQRLVAPPRQVPRVDASLRCAQPRSVTTTARASWTTCQAAPSPSDPPCESGTWTLRYRSAGALVGGPRTRPARTWRGRATGALTCSRERAATTGTPTATLAVKTLTLGAAARGERVVLATGAGLATADRARLPRACGYSALVDDVRQLLAGSRPVPSKALLGPGTVRSAVRVSGTLGRPAGLGGALARGTVVVTSTVRFAG